MCPFSQILYNIPLSHSTAPSSPPTNLMITELLSRSLHVSWDPPLPESANGIIRKYILNLTRQDTGRTLVKDSYNTTIAFRSLHPYTSYYLTVSAFTVSEGPYTAAIQIDTPEDGKLKFNDNQLCTHDSNNNSH